MNIRTSPETLRAIGSALDAIALEIDDDDAAQFVAQRADEWRMEADAFEGRAAAATNALESGAWYLP